MILHHRDTLRRLVFHRRHYCIAEYTPYWEEYCDSPLEEAQGGGFAEILHETEFRRWQVTVGFTFFEKFGLSLRLPRKAQI